MASLVCFGQGKPQISDVLAENLKAIVVSRGPCPAHFVHPGHKAKRQVKDHRVLLGVVRAKVQPIVGDGQCAFDGPGPGWGERADERDVLIVGADLLAKE